MSSDSEDCTAVGKLFDTRMHNVYRVSSDLLAQIEKSHITTMCHAHSTVSHNKLSDLPFMFKLHNYDTNLKGTRDWGFQAPEIMGGQGRRGPHVWEMIWLYATWMVSTR